MYFLRSIEALERWNEVADTLPENNYVVYGGDSNQKRTKGSVITWPSASLIDKLLA